MTKNFKGYQVISFKAYVQVDKKNIFKVIQIFIMGLYFIYNKIT